MVLIATLLALVVSVQEPSTRSVGGPVWLDDLAEATALARESGRPLFVVFR